MSMSISEVITKEADVVKPEQDIPGFAAIERISSSVTHDIKNPLNNIFLSADALNETGLNEEQANLVEMIRRNARRINNLLTEFVEATLVTQLNIRIVDLCDLLDGVLMMADDRLKAAGITVKRNYQHDCIQANVDDIRMKKVFMQLLLNAIEAIEASTGEVDLTVSAGDKEIIITLKDNGTGIPETTQPQIFEPFFTTKHGKRGLGLTFAQTIVHSHGGSLSILSHSSGGTTAFVRLPCRQPVETE
jgi:signal transduction histidine kinase